MNPEDLWAPKSGTYSIRQLHEAIQRTQRQMSDVEAMKGKLIEDIEEVSRILSVDDVRKRTHDNWPELCPCPNCDWQRFQVASIKSQFTPQ